MQIRLLGPVEVERNGQLLRLGGPKQRAVLAALALEAGRVVSTDKLVQSIWGEDAAVGAAKIVQVYVANLRKIIEHAHGGGTGPSVILTRDPGYELAVDRGQVDAVRFEQAVQTARVSAGSGDSAAAAARLRAALAEWRGPALAGLEALPLHGSAASRLEGLRLDAYEMCLEAELALGLHAALIPELEGLVQTSPFRERFRAQLVRALYGSGRQRDALRAYQEARRTFVDELGIEPGVELQALERKVLSQDPSLDVAASVLADAPTHADVAVQPLVRKRVSVVAARVVDGAQAYRLADLVTLARDHGATLLEADARQLVSVFGVPRLGADDPDRAIDLAEAMNRVGSATIGVATGLSTAAGAVVSGAPLSRAISLSRRSGRSAVRIDAATRDLIGGRATVVAGDDSFVLESLAPASARAQPATPFVGRDDELRLMRSAWRRVQSSRRLGVVTLLGAPGMGTSRLAEEFRHSHGAVEIPVACASPADSDELVVGLATALADVGHTAPDQPPAVPAALDAAALGTLVRTAAAQQQLVITIDRIDRVNLRTLRLLASAIQAARRSPVLVVATAVDDFAQRSQVWPGAVPLALALDVGPLNRNDAQRLGAMLMGDDVPGSRAAELARASGGSPLFLTELVAFATAAGGATPDRLEALLAARVDALRPQARGVLEALAVMGGPTDVTTLDEVAYDLSGGLEALVESGLVDVDDEGSLRTHDLVAEIAAAATPHDRAADLHQRAATALRPGTGARAAHLEQAARHLLAFGSEKARDSVVVAAEELVGIAWRSWSRTDVDSAVEVFARAVQLDDEAQTLIDFPELARRSRRRLAVASLTSAGSGSSPVRLGSVGLMTSSWNPDHPAERDLLNAAEACRRASTTSDEVRAACDVVIAALS